MERDKDIDKNRDRGKLKGKDRYRDRDSARGIQGGREKEKEKGKEKEKEKNKGALCNACKYFYTRTETEVHKIKLSKGMEEDRGRKREGDSNKETDWEDDRKRLRKSRKRHLVHVDDDSCIDDEKGGNFSVNMNYVNRNKNKDEDNVGDGNKERKSSSSWFDRVSGCYSPAWRTKVMKNATTTRDRDKEQDQDQGNKSRRNYRSSDEDSVGHIVHNNICIYHNIKEEEKKEMLYWREDCSDCDVIDQHTTTDRIADRNIERDRERVKAIKRTENTEKAREIERARKVGRKGERGDAFKMDRWRIVLAFCQSSSFSFCFFLKSLSNMSFVHFFLLYYLLMFLQYKNIDEVLPSFSFPSAPSSRFPSSPSSLFSPRRHSGFTSVLAWREWGYDGVTNTSKLWQETWGFDKGPRGRRGHSIALDGTRIILFGGRDDDVEREHTPRSFEVQEVDGARSFTTYEDKYLYTCNIPANSSYDGNSSYRGECENYVSTAQLYNDVWVYDLNCTRYDDESCVHQGWQILHPGEVNAGCRLVIGGQELCSMPPTRWLHDSIIFNDRTMLVYGGFSQRCEDFCSDLWSFDLRDNTWVEIYENDLYHFTAAPGKRWRFSIVGFDSMMVIFGGHRLWHGYADANSWENKWEDLSQYPPGGYLDDLWIYNKDILDDDEVVPLNTGAYGTWEKMTKKAKCYANPGAAWEERFEGTCEYPWPGPRAGHSAAIDKKRNGMWLYGGYTTFFPYPATAGIGAGDSITESIFISDIIPYGNYPYYLEDFWFYNFTDGHWTEYKTPVGEANPGPRVDHYMVLANDVIILFGGFNDNLYYGDTWYYNITGGFWLEKKSFVHAMWPESCTDDWENINKTDSNCTRLELAKDLELQPWAPYNAWDYANQPYYIPNSDHGNFWGIMDPGEDFDPDKIIPDGTPVFPYAANAPRQYAREFQYSYDGSYITLYEHCTSVKGEPTRNRVLDGEAGRAPGPIFINQPRRQAPGWDGCRDRSDNRTDLPNKLLWSQPTSRSQHRIVYSEDYELALLYGGQGLQREEVTSKDITMSVNSLNDFWQLNINRCPNNCSDHGDCQYGFCFCHPGFYGVDCSNTSCPGDFCYYDSKTNEQICKHCCSAGYSHFDNETWVEDARKVPCSLTEPGEENGICDGWGTCQCAPPYIGPDCSIRDCPHNCSFNGYCSVEYPVSRCMCLRGYYGDHCQYKQCLNNCSYPNGNCNKNTGRCTCEMTYVPYNNTRPWYKWGGEDCSFIVAFAASPKSYGWSKMVASMISILTITLTVYLFL